MKLLIVESPSKAKTINKYLDNKQFKVLSSGGHIRTLPSKNGAVNPDDNFSMCYELVPKAARYLEAIIESAKNSEIIYLATDPDREGEAISWHIAEILKSKRHLCDTPIKRVVFHEITKQAILKAIPHCKELDLNLVKAQQTRQALDYLVGFTLSPVLWRKLPGSKSAGRVQSVALRMICEREAEIKSFIPQEYWSISAQFLSIQNEPFSAELVFFRQKLEKFSIQTKQEASVIAGQLQNFKYHILSVEKKQSKWNPQPPFSTSTLIQEASRKLGFSARKTAQIAQQLYEGVNIGKELIGLITYMRTDSITISNEAVDAVATLIQEQYGNDYLPDKPRIYKTKASNAQEAHEAIRPTNITILPKQIVHHLEPDQAKLYTLIWNRTVASQMASAIYDTVVVDIISENNLATFRASGSVLVFSGFYKVYGKDSEEDDSVNDKKSSSMLPILNIGESMALTKVLENQHFTQPPPRYSEANLVKNMEELGIGRPSTYPLIISILQDRKYVSLNQKKFFPEPRGMLVSAFLSKFFYKYVEYNFTAELENQLDYISNGALEWKVVLSNFWGPFKKRTSEVLSIRTIEVLLEIEPILLKCIFSEDLKHGKTIDESRTCPSCNTGKLALRNGKFGSFLACSNYPQCSYVRKLSDSLYNTKQTPGVQHNLLDLPRILGRDQITNLEVTLRQGPYGLYLQLGEGKTAKRNSVPKHINIDNITLEYALGILSLPRLVGKTSDGIDVKACWGKFGPYIQYNNKYYSLRNSGLDPVTISLEQALTIINTARKNTKNSKNTQYH